MIRHKYYKHTIERNQNTSVNNFINFNLYVKWLKILWFKSVLGLIIFQTSMMTHYMIFTSNIFISLLCMIFCHIKATEPTKSMELWCRTGHKNMKKKMRNKKATGSHPNCKLFDCVISGTNYIDWNNFLLWLVLFVLFLSLIHALSNQNNAQRMPKKLQNWKKMERLVPFLIQV